ncbi:hypothetical protein APA_2329 [Pseudanabaena sp. lw0831]|nr:hypothetical protein APA_2329 [Pseudanabaena sp. lw0831]
MGKVGHKKHEVNSALGAISTLLAIARSLIRCLLNFDIRR